MVGCRDWVAASRWAACLIGLILPPLVHAQATVPAEIPNAVRARHDTPSSRAFLAMLEQPIPLEQIHPADRDNVRGVLANPTLKTEGPLEVFRGRPEFYHWLLDNPDQAVVLWRRLGAKCMDISKRDNGVYGWTDKIGSDINWRTVLRGPNIRIWYAEGVAKPTLLLPAIPVQAVAVLRCAESHDGFGRTFITHRAEISFRTDSKAANMVTQLIGPTSRKLARQCVAQMELFFSGLVWYIDQHPEKASEIGLCWWRVPTTKAGTEVMPAYQR